MVATILVGRDGCLRLSSRHEGKGNKRTGLVERSMQGMGVGADKITPRCGGCRTGRRPRVWGSASTPCLALTGEVGRGAKASVVIYFNLICVFKIYANLSSCTCN